MKFSAFFLALVFSALSISQVSAACVIKEQPSMTNLSLSLTETFQWDLQTLIEGTNLTYSLSPSDSQFWIQKPITLLGSPNPHIESINKIVGAKALLQKNGRTWTNSFVFIESELGTLDLFISDQTQGDTASPSFNQKISLPLDNTYINCYGVEYITYSLFILDCIDTSRLPFDNVFLIQPRSGGPPQQFKNLNINQYKYISKRILQSIKILDADSEDEQTYIFRSTPAYAAQEGKLETNSVLEVFVIGDLNEPIPLTVLDSKMLGQLLQVSDPESFKFSLIDFKVFFDGRVYILTSNQGIYILRFLGKGEFRFKNQIYESDDLAYAFGIGSLERSIYNSELISVLYKDHIRIISDQTLLKIPLSYNINYQDVISFSGNFLVIQSSSTTYLYDTYYFGESEYIYKETLEGVKTLFIHSIKPEIIVITQIDSRRYELSTGFLKFKGSKEQSLPKTVNLMATDQRESCKKIIEYQVFGTEDVSIKLIQELAFPQPLYDTPNPFYIQNVASGPNQHFLKADPQDFDIEIIKLANISINSLEVQLSDPIFTFKTSQQNIQFAKILADDYNHFKLLTQNTSNVVFIHQCTFQETYSSYASCELYKPYQSPVQLTKFNFDWLNDDTQSSYQYHVTLDTEYLATIRISSLSGVLDSFQISYKNVLIYKISSVTFIQSGICFLLKNSNYIDIWSNKGPAQLLLRIDKYTFWDLRYFEQLKLQKVVGYQDRQILFIINNKKDVIVADVLEEFRILKVISFETGEIDVVLGDNTFFILYQLLNQNFIQEYSIDEFGTIRFQKNLPIYDYILQSPLDVEFTQAGTLLVKATKKNTNSTFLLIYEPYQNYRDALTQIIQLDEIIPCLISASGRNQQIIYINHNGEYLIKSYFSRFLVRIKPIYIPNNQFLIKNVNFNVHNIISNNSILLNSTAKLVNTYVDIIINSTYLDQYPLVVNDYEVKVFEFQSELLFSGFCTNLQINCQQCGTRMEFTPIIQKVENIKFNNHYVINAVSFIDQYSIFLDNSNPQSIYIVDEQDNIITNYSLNSNPNVCKEISSTVDGKFIFTACSNKQTSSYISAANCIKTDVLECRPYGQVQFLEEVQTISQLIVQGQYIFVGQQANTFLVIYKWRDLGDQISVEFIKKFEQQEFSSLQLNFQSFQLFQQNKDLKILLLDQTKNIITLNAIFQDNELIFLDVFTVLILESFLDKENNHVYPQYQFIQIEELYPSHFNEQEQTFFIYIIVISNNGHYAIQLTYYEANLQDFQLLYTLSQFSNSKVINKISLGDGFLAILYRIEPFKSSLIVYQLPQLPLSEKSVFYGIGGAQYVGTQSLHSLFYYFSKQNTLKVFDQYDRELVNYKINPYYQIKVDNSDNGLYEEDVEISFYNSIRTEKAKIKLKRSDSSSSQQVTD